MRIQFVYTILSISLSLLGVTAMSQEIDQTTDFSIGDRVTMHSKILNEDRIINIYLPLGYSKDSAALPVIYLLDGSQHEDFIHIAGLVQFNSYPWIDRVPKSIVVGIENVDRKRDFTFPSNVNYDSTRWPERGESATFISFIEKELQPFIQENYSSSENTTLVGQSLGGLLASEVLIYHTALFKNYIIVSPSNWWDNKSMSKVPVPAIANDQKVYVAVGKEGFLMRSLACKLYRKTRSAAPRPKKVYFEYFRKNNHADILHNAVYDAFGELNKK